MPLIHVIPINMAAIRKRVKADGTPSYQALIVIKQYGVVIHRESKTFAKKKIAEDWAKRREIEIQETGVYKQKARLTVGEVIELYIDKFKPSGRSKVFDLGKLTTREISRVDVHSLTAKDLIKHVIERNKECKPQTAANDLIWLGTVIKTMSGVVDIGTDMAIFEAAREVLRREGFIAKSAHRDRRPTKEEVWKLARHFHGHYMLHIMYFAIYSCRRQEEITKLLYEDIRHEDRTCLVRDMKDPRKKGVVRRCKVPRSAYKIIMKYGNHKGRIFPHNSKTISNYFTRACHLLGIEDLHWHDFRHEGCSRLFEQGLTIQQVQQVTLHQSWSSLQRYVNLDPGDLNI